MTPACLNMNTGKLSQLGIKLRGVEDFNPQVVGYRYAQGKGIYTTSAMGPTQ